MSYVGVAKPVVAKYEEKNGKAEYSEGRRFGKAIKFEISPKYEDVSAYADINETDEEEEFVYADVMLEINGVKQEEEQMILGGTMEGNAIVSSQNDRAAYIGVGVRVKEIINGKVQYVAIWLHKAKFKEEEQDHETKGDSVNYTNPSITGRAIPDIEGKWRTKTKFETMEEADSWLDEMAGIEEGGENTWHM